MKKLAFLFMLTALSAANPVLAQGQRYATDKANCEKFPGAVWVDWVGADPDRLPSCECALAQPVEGIEAVSVFRPLQRIHVAKPD